MIGNANVSRERHSAVNIQTSTSETDRHEASISFLSHWKSAFVWTAQPDGWLDYSSFWHAYTGLAWLPTHHWGWGTIVHPDDIQRCFDCWQEAISTKQCFEIELRIQRASNTEYLWHLLRALPRPNEQGDVVQWIGTCLDISSQQESCSPTACNPLLQQAATSGDIVVIAAQNHDAKKDGLGAIAPALDVSAPKPTLESTATPLAAAYHAESASPLNPELIRVYNATIDGWSCLLDLRDKETEGHSERVTYMALQLAERLGMPEAERLYVRWGALLHDIGKIGIPDDVLKKPGPLNEEEWAMMQKHPGYAYEILWPVAFLRPALAIPYCHHEKWDGSGYPNGLEGEQIPLSARLFAVIDVWDALRSDRPYRPGWPKDRVIEHLRSQAGTHFDPHVVEVFLSLLETDDAFCIAIPSASPIL